MRAFHYKEFMHPNMKWYVRKFPERLAKSPVLHKAGEAAAGPVCGRQAAATQKS